MYLCAYVATGAVFLAIVAGLVRLGRGIHDEARLIDAQQGKLLELGAAAAELNTAATHLWRAAADDAAPRLRLQEAVRHFGDELDVLRQLVMRLEDTPHPLRRREAASDLQADLAAMYRAWDHARMEFSDLQPGAAPNALQAAQEACQRLQQYGRFAGQHLAALQSGNYDHRAWLITLLVLTLVVLGLLMMWFLWSATQNRMEIVALNMVLEHRVTERTAEFEKLNLHLASVQASIGSALVVTDTEYNVLSWNPAAEKLSGVPRERALGRSIVELPPVGGLQPFATALAEALQRSQPRFLHELALGDPGGRRRFGNASMFPLRGRLGEPRGVVILIDDVTQMVEARHELARKTCEAVKSNRLLQRTNAELGQIVYAASHDLRGPLVNLAGLIRKLDRTCEQARQQFRSASGGDVAAVLDHDLPRLVSRINANIHKCGSIIDGLLKYSRTGREEYRSVDVDMEHEVARVVELYAATIEETGAHVYIAELPPARGDADAVNQVLANLIGNALNYLDPRRCGEIIIQGERRRDHCVYRVRDNGAGIKPADLERVFKMFERLDPGRARGEGLGLAIVRKIVERLGGEVGVESQWGEGSTFWFTLPAGRARFGEALAPAAAAAVSGAAGPEACSALELST